MHLKRKKTLIIAVLCNITVILLELIGFFAQGNGIALSVFYTNDSNILALAASVIWLIAFCCDNNPPPRWIMVLKYAAATCLGLTFLTVICFLAPLSGYRFMLLQGTMLYQHLLCPAFVLISFLFFEEYHQIKKTDILFAIMPTILYGEITVGMNFQGTLHGPYPFLLVKEQPPEQSILWGSLILATTIGIAALVRIIKNKRRTHHDDGYRHNKKN